MSIIHYCNGANKSTVVILRDGRAMEIRDGEKTRWSSEGTGRRYWRSVEEWALWLPLQWPSVEAWAPLRPLPLPPHLPLLSRTVRPLLATFLGLPTTDAEATGADIENALLTYIAFHRLQLRNVWLDDFLVCLSGLRPDMGHSVVDVVRAVWERQVIVI